MYLYVCIHSMSAFYYNYAYMYMIIMYRKAHSDASMQFLAAILNKDVPFLVCLTFGDRLFAECMPSPTRHSHPDVVGYPESADLDVATLLQEHKEVSAVLFFMAGLYCLCT